MDKDSTKIEVNKTDLSLPEEQDFRKNKDGICHAVTSRQEIFCQQVANGVNHTEAAKIAGYKDTPHLHVNASRMARKPYMRIRILELQKELCSRFLLTREQMLIELGRIMRCGKDKDIIAAIGLAAKMQGMLVDDVNLNLNKTPKEMSDDELMTILLKAKDGSDTDSAGVIKPPSSQN